MIRAIDAQAAQAAAIARAVSTAQAAGAAVVVAPGAAAVEATQEEAVPPPTGPQRPTMDEEWASLEASLLEA